MTTPHGKAQTTGNGLPQQLTLPAENPYARDHRIAMNHRVYETLSARLAELSQALVEAGYSPRTVSQAELLQMILHDSTPRGIDDAAPRLQAWGLLKSAPPPRERE